MRKGVGLIAALFAAGVWAHGGEDHGDEASAAPAAAQAASPATEASQRLPDGSLFVPKRVQRELQLRTLEAVAAPLARSVEMSGRVIADPRAGGRVQASQPGRVAPAAGGFPLVGQRVKKGQLIGYLHPTIGAIERGNQQAQLADLAAQTELARRKLARLEQLEGAVPRKDIEAARLELQSLTQRRAALGRALARPEALVASASGVIGASYVVAGQIVDAGDLLFEIIDPERLAVEALAYDPALAGGLQDAVAVLPGGQLGLRFSGAARVLREQALPLLFSVESSPASVAVGQPVKVVAQTSARVNGVAVPAAAVTRRDDGSTHVWLHPEAERFVLRRVDLQPLDADRVAVVSGLHGGERVVVQGASLLAQIR